MLWGHSNHEVDVAQTPEACVYNELGIAFYKKRSEGFTRTGYFFSWVRWDYGTGLWTFGNLRLPRKNVLNTLKTENIYLKGATFEEKSPCGHAGSHGKLVFCIYVYVFIMLLKNA